MTIWTPQRTGLHRPYYRSLAESVIRDIESGVLKTGDRLPTHRALADQLGLSVQTVSRAFEELIRLGLVKGEVGRGSYIAASNQDGRTPFVADGQYDSVIDCSILKPVSDDIHHQAMQSALQELARDLPRSAIFSFRPHVVTQRYLAPAMQWLTRCGVTTRPELLHFTNGSTPAMMVALMSAAKPGELVATEEIGHHTLKPLTRNLGLRLSAVAIDHEGIVPDALDTLCRSKKVRALYIMPGGIGPTTATMSLSRREQITAVAREHDITIIENDALGPLQGSRPPPLQALAAERTLYFTGFSKCLMPGLRTGYLVAPESLSRQVSDRQLVSNWMATPLLAEIASRWVVDGTAEELLQWQRRALLQRNRVAADLLSTPFHALEYGMHLWLPLSEGWSEERFVTQCQLQGVAVAPGSTFVLSERQQPPAVRVCLGSVAASRLQQGLGIINRLLIEPADGIAASQ